MRLREQLGSGARRVWRVRFLGVADVSQRCFCSRPCETPVRDSMTPTGENWKQQRGLPRIRPPWSQMGGTCWAPWSQMGGTCWHGTCWHVGGPHLLEAHVQGGWHRTADGRWHRTRHRTRHRTDGTGRDTGRMAPDAHRTPAGVIAGWDWSGFDLTDEAESADARSGIACRDGLLTTGCSGNYPP